MEHERHERRGEAHPHREEARPPQQRRKHKRRKGSAGFILGTILLIGVVTCAMFAGIFMTYVKTTLAPTLDVDIDDYNMSQSTIVYYTDKDTGEDVEMETLKAKEYRILVDYDQIPDAMWQAAVAIEDKRFFEHHGVDWQRTIGATVNMFFKQRNTYGGSTITQQTLKNMTKDNKPYVNRKVREIFRALEFEKKYTKPQILELYLNYIYLGKGCYGVEAAAKYYFDKDVWELSTAECASIIAITNNPSLYGPMYKITYTRDDGTTVTPRQLNKQRQETILEQMYKQGYIKTEAEYEAAVNEELHFIEREGNADETLQQDDKDQQYQSYFVDQVRRDVTSDLMELWGLDKKATETKLLSGGYRIYTTMDPDIQAIAESVYADRGNLKNLTSASGQLIRSGITIVDVTNGNVVAMVGDMGEKQGDMVWNYATDVHQCGSSIKPISTYAAALENGAITMADSFDNYPVQLLNGTPWPKNSPPGYSGMVSLQYGVAQSLNTVAVRTILKLGLDKSYQFMTENMGITTLTEEDRGATGALALGGLSRGVTTEEMAAAFAAFANGGIYNSPRLYTRVTDADGNVILENETETHVAMKESTAYFMNQLLQGAVRNGTGASANFGNMAIAGKTGTTSDNYDRYFAGYTPYYAAAVWTGYKNNERISYSGNPALTLWRKVMSQVHEGLEYKSFPKASGLTSVTVCMDSGLLATDACRADARGRVQTVQVVPGTEPTESCARHVFVNYCTEGQCVAGEYCPESSIESRVLLDYDREVFLRADGTPFDIPVGDSAYILKNNEPEGGCPVHQHPVEPVEPVEPTDPDEPDPPAEGGDTGDGDWFGNLWGGD